MVPGRPRRRHHRDLAAVYCRPSWCRLCSHRRGESRRRSRGRAVPLRLVRCLGMFTMSRSIRRWARRNVWSLSLVSVRKVQPYKSAGGRRYRAAEQTWSAVERVPIACEFVAKLVITAPSRRKSVGEFCLVELAAKIFGGLESS